MTVTLLSGAEPSTSNTDNNVRDMIPVADLEPNAAPLVQLMNKLGSKPARNPKVEWLEDELKPRIAALTASAAATSGAGVGYTVTPDIFTVGDVVNFPAYGFGALVTATAAGAITGTTIGTVVSAVSAAEVFLVANANAEGSSLTEIKITQLVTQFNYCEIVQEPFGVTGTENATEHYSGDERARLRKKHGIIHARQLEQISFFGPAPAIIGANQRISAGLKYYIDSGNVNAYTTMSLAQWEAALRTGFRYGSEEKWAFCSPKGAQAVNGFAANNIRVVNDLAATYGVDVKQYVSAQGRVNIVMHRDWADSAVYGGYIFLVDMDAVKSRPLRPTRLDADVQAPDYDGYKDRWFSEYTIAVQHGRKHGLITGLNGANS
jgi:hypothetical protein